MFKYTLSLFCFILVAGCKHTPAVTATHADKMSHADTGLLKTISTYDHRYSTIHVIVALCDNKYQGIVPVPAAIGNGQDPDNNLYWGNNYGVRSYFKNSRDWKLVSRKKIDSIILERVVFKHTTKNYYLVADAYNGKYIKNATNDLLYSCSGLVKDTIHTGNVSIGINGNAKLIAYIGHDGLMDFNLARLFTNKDGQSRDCIILACISRKYFAFPLKATKANPLLWTDQLMCPEAYTLHDAVAGYINHESAADIRIRAVKAYSKYQKCRDKESKSILVTGW